jgi:hypothetical protein
MSKTPEKHEAQNDLIRRAIFGSDDRPVLRSIDEEKNYAEFVIATAAPVRDSYYGPPTSLQMGGVNMKRYKNNPVVLAQHKHGVLEVIGTGSSIRVENDELICGCTFDVDDEFAARVWGKVKRKVLRMASVGFLVTRERLIQEGKTDKKTGLTGPVRLATAWELHEWSIVAVGADPDALGRQAVQEPDDHDDAADDERGGFSLSGAIVEPSGFRLS